MTAIYKYCVHKFGYPNLWTQFNTRKCLSPGRTGHTILSTLHANSARDAYDRILTMCLQAGTKLSEERLLKNIVSAFPLMVFKMRLPDGSRKYVEIFEATGVQNGELQGNTLFRYKVHHHERDESGRIIKTHGQHIHVGSISEALAERLSLCGVDREQLRRFLKPAEKGGRKI